MTWSAYVEYKESESEYLGKVPTHWTVSKFSRHILINSGQVDPRIDPYCAMPLIAPNHIESGTGKLSALESAKEQGADSGKYLVREGQVIYSKIRPNLAKAVIAPADCLCSADMYGLSPDPTVLDSDFALRVLLSRPFTHYVIDSSMRVAMPKVNHESLGAAPVWFPPLGEQRQIVTYLDRETARIDALIAKQEQLIATLREDRTAAITHAVTEGLDPRAEMKSSGIELQGPIPSHWNLFRLKWVLSEPLKYGANEAADDAEPEQPRFVRITDIASDGSLHKETFRSLPPEKAAPYMLAQGDILLARSGATVGKSFMYDVSWGNCCFAGYLIRARVDENLLLPGFLRYTTSSAPYWQYIESAQIQATIQNVSAERYGNFAFPIPSVSEQRDIVDFLDERCGMIDTLVAKATEVIETMREYRAALITAAVTGTIDVREAI